MFQCEWFSAYFVVSHLTGWFQCVFDCDFSVFVCDFIVCLWFHCLFVCNFSVYLCGLSVHLCNFSVYLCDFSVFVCDFNVYLCNFSVYLTVSFQCEFNCDFSVYFTLYFTVCDVSVCVTVWFQFVSLCVILLCILQCDSARVCVWFPSVFDRVWFFVYLTVISVCIWLVWFQCVFHCVSDSVISMCFLLCVISACV